MNAIEAFVPSDVVKAFAAFLEFCYIARRNIITDDSLEQLTLGARAQIPSGHMVNTL
jgi:hypothetical protein